MGESLRWGSLIQSSQSPGVTSGCLQTAGAPLCPLLVREVAGRHGVAASPLPPPPAWALRPVLPGVISISYDVGDGEREEVDSDLSIAQTSNMDSWSVSLVKRWSLS